MSTVGRVLEQTTQLRSRIAITEYWIHFLKSNAVDSDAGTAELKFTRSDYGLVPQDHVAQFVIDLEEMLEKLQAELEHWEGLVIAQPDELLADGTNGKKQLVKKRKVKHVRREADSGSDDHSTSD